MTPKPCACAPGCGSPSSKGIPPYDRLCIQCGDLFSTTHAFRRAAAAKDMPDYERHLADWARTRSAELVQDRLKAKGAQP